MKNALRFMALCVALAFPVLAHAQLTLTLENPNQSGYRGATLSYIGTLTNDGTSPLFLTGAGINVNSVNGTDFDVDSSPFLDGLGDLLSLDAGQSYTGELFTVMVGADAASQIAPGIFSIVGGAEEGAQDTLATASFSVAAAPEPATLALLTVGMAAGIILRRRAASRR